MEKGRDDFSETTRRRLAERVAFRCSNPVCGKATTGPHTSFEKSIRIGRAAHICAAAQGGPRYSAAQSVDERISILNAIWLCANCADIIDKDERAYSAKLLREWKDEAEAAALKEVQSSSGQSTPDAVRLSIVKKLYNAYDLLACGEGVTRIAGLQPTANELERVRRIVEECEAVAANLEKVKLIRACYLLAIGEIDLAFEISSELSSCNDPGWLLIHAQCLHKLGRAGESIPLLEAVAQIPDLKATALYNIGLAYDDVEDRSKAIDSYEQAIIEDPEYAYPHSRLAKIAYSEGRLDVAIVHSMIARDLEPKDEVLWNRLGLVLLDTGQIDKALKILKEAVHRFPRNSDLHGLLGRAFGQAGLLDAAEEELRLAVTMNPRDNVGWYNLGYCLIMQCKFDEGLRVLRKAVDEGYSEGDLVERFETLISSALMQLNLDEGSQE